MRLRYTTKINLLCFVLGPIVMAVGGAHKFTDIKIFNVLGIICALVGILIMLLLQFGKFEEEDESATFSYGKASSFVLELVLLLGCGANFVAMIKDTAIVINPANFAIVTGFFMIILGVAFKICERRGNL